MLINILTFVIICLLSFILTTIYNELRNMIHQLPEIEKLHSEFLIGTIIYTITIYLVFGDAGLYGVLVSYFNMIFLLNVFYLFLNRVSLDDAFSFMLLKISVAVIIAIDLALNTNNIYYLIVTTYK